MSEDYFKTRTRSSQLGAWSSKQSSVLSSRSVLENNYNKYEKKFKEKEVPLPKDWGGVVVKAIQYEFWQGQEDRLHDRIVYKPVSPGKYLIQRLFP